MAIHLNHFFAGVGMGFVHENDKHLVYLGACTRVNDETEIEVMRREIEALFVGAEERAEDPVRLGPSHP